MVEVYNHVALEAQAMIAEVKGARLVRVVPRHAP